MRNLIRMVVALTVICAGAALMLSYTNQATKSQREYQLLKYVREPSIRAVLSGYDNDPIKDRLVIELEEKDEKGRPIQRTLFPAKKGGKVIAVAFASSATGYHGLIEVMVGVDMEGKLTGVGIMTHTETPGLGAKIEQEDFRGQFKRLALTDALNLASEGGKIDSISGATLSSRGVVAAVREALKLFPRVKEEVT